MIKTGTAALIMIAALVAARAQTTVPGQPIVPLGFCQIAAAALASAVKLSTACNIPAGATMAWLQAENANVRYRDDGQAPSASVGSLILSGNPGMFYNGTLGALQFVAATGSPVLDVAFYR
jgi:hypothetical protein